MDSNQTPEYRTDGSAYVRGPQGKRVKIRHLGPNGEFVFSAAGNQFLSETPLEEHIVSIPCILEGRRSSGRPYTRESTLPLDTLGLVSPEVSRQMSERERDAYIKRQVLAQLE